MTKQVRKWEVKAMAGGHLKVMEGGVAIANLNHDRKNQAARAALMAAAPELEASNEALRREYLKLAAAVRLFLDDRNSLENLAALEAML